MNRPRYNRKTAPKVKSGQVQRKNRHNFTARQGHVIDRVSPAKGCRHMVTKRDVRTFINLIPNWHELSEGIECILLSSGAGDYAGLYEHFVHESTACIRLAAWEGDLWDVVHEEWFREHRWIFDRLGVAYDHTDDGWQCRFTPSQARAFMLLHIFMHELGHHVDRMRSRSQNATHGQERFAEHYANEWFDRLLPKYIEAFGPP